MNGRHFPSIPKKVYDRPNSSIKPLVKKGRFRPDVLQPYWLVTEMLAKYVERDFLQNGALGPYYTNRLE